MLLIINNESGKSIYRNTVEPNHTIPRTGEYISFHNNYKKVASVIWDTDLNTILIIVEN